MSSANPYAAPQSDVNAEVGATGSVDDAVAGRYDFEIGDVLREAWRLTNGFKLTFWVSYLILVLGLGTLVMGLIFGLRPLGGAGIAVAYVLYYALAFILSVGFCMLAVRRAAGLKVEIGTAFSYFDRWQAALIGGIVYMVVVGLGTMLLIIPGIYLGVACSMVFQLIGDRRMGPLQALETSRKALTHKWFKIFFTWVATGLLAGTPAGLVWVLVKTGSGAGTIVLASLLLFIPMFWTMPWFAMVLGVLYRRIFGVATQA